MKETKTGNGHKSFTSKGVKLAFATPPEDIFTSKIDFKLINDWERATNDLCNHFILKYFGKDADTYWIADEVGGVLFINDYFFDVNNILDFLRNKYSVKMMFRYYDYQLKQHENNEDVINIKTYKKLK